MDDDNFNIDFKAIDVVYVALVVLAFLFGIVVTYTYYQNTSNDLNVTQKQLRKAEIYGLLTDSIIETKDYEFEAAYKNVNNFFDELQNEKSKGEDGILNGVSSEKIDFILDSRDETIGELKQENKSSLDSLKEIHKAYVQNVGKNSKSTVILKH